MIPLHLIAYEILPRVPCKKTLAHALLLNKRFHEEVCGDPRLLAGMLCRSREMCEALDWAISRDRVRVVEALYEIVKSADPEETCDESPFSVWHTAATYGSLRVLDMLHGKRESESESESTDAYVQGTVLHSAARHGHVHVLAAYRCGRYGPRNQELAYHKAGQHLHTAAKTDRVDVLAFLLRNEARWRDRETINAALGEAIQSGSLNAMCTLCDDYGGDPTTQENVAAGYVAAGIHDKACILPGLEKYGVCWDTRRVFLAACTFGCFATLRVLLTEYGVDPRMEDDAAVMQAAAGGQCDVIELLCDEYGADPRARYDHALQLAHRDDSMEFRCTRRTLREKYGAVS